MEKEKTVDALNTLLEINNDRIEGYEKASENTEERDLKDLFSNFKKTSLNCRLELVSEINKLSGEATDETNTSGKFFRAWMDFKASLTGRDRKAILDSCEYGEEQADNTYQNVLEDESEHLSREQLSMIKKQHKHLKADYSKIKTMQNATVAAS